MLRAMEPTDAPAVTHIFKTSLHYDNTDTEVVLRRIMELSEDPRTISLVWEDDATGKVTGFIHALRYDTLHNEGGWDVISLAVDCLHQGTGIGRRLLEEVECRIRRMGGSFVRLNSSLQRTEAHAFYEHLGYVSRKTQRHFIKHLRSSRTSS